MQELNQEVSQIKLINSNHQSFALKFSKLGVEKLKYKPLAILQPKLGETIWIHLFSKNMGGNKWTDSQKILPEKVKHFLKNKNSQPSINYQKNYLYGLLTDIPCLGISQQKYSQRILYFYLDQNFFITLAYSDAQSITSLCTKLINSPKQINPILLLTYLIDELKNNFACKVENLMVQLNKIEDKILLDKKQKLRQQRAILNRTRHHLLIIKRLIDPEQMSLMPALSYSSTWISKSSLHNLKQAVNQFHYVHHILDNLYERADLLHEELMSLLSDELNHKLLVLSIMSALLLPGTLISSIFGMNIPGLPGANSAHAFWILISIMLVLAVFILALLKRFKLW